MLRLALSGAGDRVRTGDLHLGKVPLYQLSHSRRLLLSRSPLYTMDYYERSYPDVSQASACGTARAHRLPAQLLLALPFRIPRLWRAPVARLPG